MGGNGVERVGWYQPLALREEGVAGAAADERRQVGTLVEARGADRHSAVNIGQEIICIEVAFAEVVFKPHRVGAGGLDLVEEALRHGVAFSIAGIVRLDSSCAPLTTLELIVVVGVVAALGEVDVGVGEGRGGYGSLAEVAAPWGGIDPHLVRAVDAVELIEIGESARAVGLDGVPTREVRTVALDDGTVGSDDRDVIEGVRRKTAAGDRDDLAGEVVVFVGSQSGGGLRQFQKTPTGAEGAERNDEPYQREQDARCGGTHKHQHLSTRRYTLPQCDREEPTYIDRIQKAEALLTRRGNRQEPPVRRILISRKRVVKCPKRVLCPNLFS